MSVPNPATTKWVPLQGVIAERMAYWGSYSASKTYNDGDCAIGADGILYMCVQNGTVNKAPVKWGGAATSQGPVGPQGPIGVGIPTPVVNGQWVKGVGGSAVWTALTLADIPNAKAKPTYGTSFPASPVDGQEHILVDSVSAPKWSWYCRYNTSSTRSYKWEVLGGTPINATYITQTALNVAGAWVNVVSPAITLPREADYLFTASCRVNNSWGAAQHMYMMMWYNAQGNVFGPQPLVGLINGYWGALAVSPFIATFGVGTGIGVSVLADGGLPAYAGEIAWSAMPIRIL